jgi:hypothetical protein
MADTTTIEFIKTVGGFAGLATAVFTIWDRWVRGRPLAWVTAERRFSGDPEDYICFKNPGYGDVFIRAVRVYPKTPKIYGVAKDHSAEAITSSFYADVNVLLPPGEQQYLPIIGFPKDIDKPLDTSRRWVCFLISWRKTSSAWLPQFPIPVIISTRDIARISAGRTQSRIRLRSV